MAQHVVIAVNIQYVLQKTMNSAIVQGCVLCM